MKKLISTLFFILLIQLPAVANENPQAMLVFDASGSMWGQVEGKTKIEIAKTALNKVVSDWDENIHLGLIAYGHRKKGDCNDIQTLVPVAKLDKQNMVAKVKAINPKGKTPISRSLKKAAENLRYTEEKATIILISDGKETCNADPCATAKSLEGEGIDFVAHVIGFDVDKKTSTQLKCIADATGGEYFSAKNASSLNDAMTKIVEKVQKEEPKPPVTNIKKTKNNVEITASEKEGSKWVRASHAIYKVVDGEAERSYIRSCSSTKKEACIKSLPIGKYLIKSSFNKYKKETELEIKADEVSKIHINMGETGKVEITASEKEGSKLVKAYHYVYKIVDGEVDRNYSASCGSDKKQACIKQLPLGNYVVKSKFNKHKKETRVEIKSGEVSKIHINMGETGKVEIAASEKEGSKWVKTYHYIHKIEDDEVDRSYIASCWSDKKKACLKQLPIGQYLIKSKFNKLKKETRFELKAGETTQVNLVMGETGSVEITAVENEGGKWVKAYHYVHKIADGEVEKGYLAGCWSKKKKECVEQLPIGQYMMKSTFNKFKKETPFEVKPGEITKLQIVMGQTGKAQISASEKVGSKWVRAYHYINKVVDGEVESAYLAGCWSDKKKECVEQIPVGKYLVKSSFKSFKKETPLEVTAGETSKLHVTFAQFFIDAKCTDMNATINYEIYASNGRMVFEKQGKCSDQIKVPIDDGDYTVESKINNETKETQFSVGGDHPSSLTIDMQTTNKKSDHEELIKADTQEKTKSEALQEKPSEEDDTTSSSAD